MTTRKDKLQKALAFDEAYLISNLIPLHAALIEAVEVLEEVESGESYEETYYWSIATEALSKIDKVLADLKE